MHRNKPRPLYTYFKNDSLSEGGIEGDFSFLHNTFYLVEFSFVNNKHMLLLEPSQTELVRKSRKKAKIS